MPHLAEAPDELPLLTQTQAAEFLAVSKRTLESWRSHGGGPPYVRVGRGVRYRMEALQEWIEERTFGGEVD